MQIEQKYIDFIERSVKDEDVRQELYLKLLELEEPEHWDGNWKGWITRAAFYTMTTEQNKEKRRKELEAEAVKTLEGLVGIDDNRDPLEYLEAEEVMSKMTEELTPLMCRTLESILEGKSPEEIAEDEGVSANTIYQRTFIIKKILGV